MSVGTLSPQQLRSLVEDKWQRDEDALAVGLHVTTSWVGPGEVEFDFGKAQVVRADTVFQVREALLAAERDKDRIILLTKLQQGDLGNDVVARLARSRLFPIDHWASLCALFKAKELDRSICDPAIAQALLEYAPPDGYPPVSAGILDAGTVWRAISRHVFEMGESEPDLVSLLLWATTKSGVSPILECLDGTQDQPARRLVGNLGDAADSILRFIDSGAGADALALAVVCQVVFGDGKDTTLDAAAARMEQYHDNKPIPPSIGRCLGPVADGCHCRSGPQGRSRLAQHHLQRADELLRQFRCEDHAYRNRLTLLGYEQRLARFGEQIEVAIDTPSEEAIRACEELQDEIANHRLAKLGRQAESDFQDRDGAAAGPLAGSSAASTEVVPGNRSTLPQGTGVRRLGTGIDLPGRGRPRTLQGVPAARSGGAGTPGGVQPALRQGAGRLDLGGLGFAGGHAASRMCSRRSSPRSSRRGIGCC